MQLARDDPKLERLTALFRDKTLSMLGIVVFLFTLFFSASSQSLLDLIRQMQGDKAPARGLS